MTQELKSANNVLGGQLARLLVPYEPQPPFTLSANTTLHFQHFSTLNSIKLGEKYLILVYLQLCTPKCWLTPITHSALLALFN